jgi:hypothetical protein
MSGDLETITVKPAAAPPPPADEAAPADSADSDGQLGGALRPRGRDGKPLMGAALMRWKEKQARGDTKKPKPKSARVRGGISLTTGKPDRRTKAGRALMADLEGRGPEAIREAFSRINPLKGFRLDDNLRQLAAAALADARRGDPEGESINEAFHRSILDNIRRRAGEEALVQTPPQPADTSDTRTGPERLRDEVEEKVRRGIIPAAEGKRIIDESAKVTAITSLDAKATAMATSTAETSAALAKLPDDITAALGPDGAVGVTLQHLKDVKAAHQAGLVPAATVPPPPPNQEMLRVLKFKGGDGGLYKDFMRLEPDFIAWFTDDLTGTPRMDDAAAAAYVGNNPAAGAIAARAARLLRNLGEPMPREDVFAVLKVDDALGPPRDPMRLTPLPPNFSVFSTKTQAEIAADIAAKNAADRLLAETQKAAETEQLAIAVGEKVADALAAQQAAAPQQAAPRAASSQQAGIIARAAQYNNQRSKAASPELHQKLSTGSSEFTGVRPSQTGPNNIVQDYEAVRDLIAGLRASNQLQLIAKTLPELEASLQKRLTKLQPTLAAASAASSAAGPAPAPSASKGGSKPKTTNTRGKGLERSQAQAQEPSVGELLNMAVATAENGDYAGAMDLLRHIAAAYPERIADIRRAEAYMRTL